MSKRTERLESLVVRLISLNEQMDAIKREIESVKNELLKEEDAKDNEKAAEV